MAPDTIKAHVFPACLTIARVTEDSYSVRDSYFTGRGSGRQCRTCCVRWTYVFVKEVTLQTFSRWRTLVYLYWFSKALWVLWGGTRWRSWLRHRATSRKVAGSIPDGVIGIFHWHNPSGRGMALGLTQHLTEMSTRNISWGAKAASA